MARRSVQDQFSPSAADYVRSAVHAHGASLTRIRELAEAGPGTRALDVATGGGHTASMLAAQGATVVGLDATPAMLAAAREQNATLALTTKLTWVLADSQQLPFAGFGFELVVCRLAAHHFVDIDRFLAEARRVLVQGGRIIVVDNVVPGSHRRGKRAEAQRRAGRFINALERLRDPSHERCLSLDEWQTAFYDNGLRLTHRETLPMTLDFAAWTARMRVPADNIIRLEVMLRQAPAAAAAFLSPRFRGRRIEFTLQEAVLVGQKL